VPRYVHGLIKKFDEEKKIPIRILCFGSLQMRKWKAWEEETKTIDYQSAHGRYLNLI